MSTATLAARDTLGCEIRVSTEVVDGRALIVLERDGETLADFEPAQALALGHVLRTAG